MKLWIRKQRNYQANKQNKKTQLHLLFGWNGPPFLGLKKHLSWMGERWFNGDGGAMFQWRWRRGSVGGLRDKESQGIHG